MLHETEIKIPLKNEMEVNLLLQKCESLSDSLREEEMQLDEYFDTYSEELREKDLTIRIRTINNHAKIALKSPRVYLTRTIHRRIELEFDVLNSLDVRNQILSQGLIPSVVIEKRRWNFLISGYNISIDQLPLIGYFVEIEGDGTDSIKKMVNILGLSSEDAVSEHYGELLESELKKLGLPTRPNLRATFRAYIEHNSQPE